MDSSIDGNGDGFIDLDKPLAQLPFEATESYDGERLAEVSSLCRLISLGH